MGNLPFGFKLQKTELCYCDNWGSSLLFRLYVQRNILHKDVKPMLSALEDIQELHERELKEQVEISNKESETA